MEEKLKAQLDSYLAACYGEVNIHPIQRLEVSQAFYSGIVSAIAVVAGVIDELGENGVEELKRIPDVAHKLALELNNQHRNE